MYNTRYVPSGGIIRNYGKSPILIGNSSINRPCSILAILSDQRLAVVINIYWVAFWTQFPIWWGSSSFFLCYEDRGILVCSLFVWRRRRLSNSTPWERGMGAVNMGWSTLGPHSGIKKSGVKAGNISDVRCSAWRTKLSHLVDQVTWDEVAKSPDLTNANGIPREVVFVFAATPLMMSESLPPRHSGQPKGPWINK